VDWIYLAQDRDRWWASAIIVIRVVSDCIAVWTTAAVSSKGLLHGTVHQNTSPEKSSKAVFVFRTLNWSLAFHLKSFSFLVSPLLPTHSRFRGLLLCLITLSDTHTHHTNTYTHHTHIHHTHTQYTHTPHTPHTHTHTTHTHTHTHTQYTHHTHTHTQTHTHTHTHTHTLDGNPLDQEWAREKAQHSEEARQPCSWRDLNAHSQEASGRKPTLTKIAQT